MDPFGIFIIVALFAFGAIIGSFLNVVVLRYNTGKTVRGRSACMSCRKKLAWYELLPVVSFIGLRGKCSACKCKISPQYPTVEALAGVAAVMVFLVNFGIPGIDISISFMAAIVALLDFIVWCLLIAIGAYDLKHMIIPNGLALAFGVAALLKLLVVNGAVLFAFPGILDLLAGPILFVPFYLLWKLSGGTMMGLGDGKLSIGIGLFLGLAGGIEAVVYGFWIGALVSVGSIVAQKIFTKHPTLGWKSEIPFAPFLILGTLVFYITKWDIMGLSLLLSL